MAVGYTDKKKHIKAFECYPDMNNFTVALQKIVTCYFVNIWIITVDMDLSKRNFHPLVSWII